ncbi:MAG: hypothetical protein ACXW4P_03910 [Thermoanaerobaculia bacterium]
MALLAALASHAAAAAPLTRTLVVVIWERRAAETKPGQARYRQVQKTNRETVLALLYGPKQALLPDASAVVAIYPEGVASVDSAPQVFRDIQGVRDPEVIWRDQLPHLISLPEWREPIQAIVQSPPPRESDLDVMIRRYVTYPLVGLPPEKADDPEIDELDGSIDVTATRGVSQPPLHTAWALHNAVERLGMQRELFEHVFVIWVHGGERNYTVANPRRRIGDDYGSGAARLYEETLLLYSLQRDESRGTDGELADGNVVIFRVLPRHAVRTPPTASIRNGGQPAYFRHEVTNLWTGSILGPKFFLRQFQKAVDAVPSQRWTYTVDSPGYQILDAQYVARNGLTAPVGANGVIEGGLPPFLHRIAPPRQRSWNVDTDLFVDALLEPALPDDVPPYLRSAALRIPVRHPSARAPASIHLSAVHPAIEWGAAGVILAGLVAIFVHVRHRNAQRSLSAVFDWRGPRDEANVRGEASTPLGSAVFSIADRSGFRPVRRPLRVRVEISSPQGTLPVRDDALLHLLVQPDHRTEGQALEFFLQPAHRASERRNTRDIDVRLQGRAVDFARIHAGQPLSGVYLLTVNVEGSDRYESLQTIEARPFGMTVQTEAASPQAKLVIDDLVRRRGLFLDPVDLHEPVELVVGSVILTNPTPLGGVALDVDIVRTGTAAWLVGDHGKVEHELELKTHAVRQRETAAGVVPGVVWAAGDQNRLRIRNAGIAEFVVSVALPPGKRWIAREQWLVRMEVTFACESGGRTYPLVAEDTALWYPVNEHAFACLDLGTSATRLLIQGDEESTFGYLPFPRRMRPDEWPEDLPAMAFVDVRKNEVVFGLDARHRGLNEPKKLFASVKEPMIIGAGDYKDVFRLYIEKLLETYYVPNVHVDDKTPEQQHVELVNESYIAGAPRAIARGKLPLLVATIPNEATPALVRTIESAALKNNVFRKVTTLREAEAAALWYASENAAELRTHGTFIRILALDIGAGTTDAAVVRVANDSIEVQARAGVPAAGNHVDRAILAALRTFPGTDVEHEGGPNRSLFLKQLEQAHALKIAIAQEEERPLDSAIAAQFDGEPVDLRQIAASPAYRRALCEIVDEPLIMLAGRARAKEDLQSVDVLLLTGRGSLIAGVPQQVKETLGALGVSFGKTSHDRRNRGLFLKAAVSLGARVYGRRRWSRIRLSDDVFPDRILLVAAGPYPPRIFEVMPAGTSLDPGGTLHFVSKRIEPESWQEAMLIRTWLRNDDAFGGLASAAKDKRLSEILLHSDLSDFRVKAYSVIAGEIGDPGRPSVISIDVDVDSRISWRIQPHLSQKEPQPDAYVPSIR